MKKATAFALVGGDMRQVYLAGQLAHDGNAVGVYGLERHSFSRDVMEATDLRGLLASSDVIILPMPVLQDNKRLNAPLANAPHKITDILDAVPTGSFVLGGAVTGQIQEMAEQRGFKIYDYLKREELAILNAIPTA